MTMLGADVAVAAPAGRLGRFGVVPAVVGAVALGAVAVLLAAGPGAGVSPARLAMLLLIAPVLEETIFRAGLHESLLRRSWPAGRALVATAIVFALVHALLRSDLAALAVVLPALAIGLLYQRTRRLVPCIALHAAMNALWLGWNLL
jgi:membrane protease YdiL (CAAX protease family)